MQIKRLSAVFGRLRSETIQFSDGLNIIEAPNESGKSTWCAFLTAMLYGINSRERDRADYIADKNRYAPWDGTVMAGSMDCRSEGRDITISRDTRRQTAPMAEFRAVYSGTNIAIDGLTGQNCGEALLGVTREVFERSAFIRQSGLAISQDAGLERRVAALISSGEEDTSYTEAYDALKKQLNRRRYNKSGLLPALEAQQAETQAQLNRVQQLRQQETALHAQLQDLIQQQAALSDELCSLAPGAERRSMTADLFLNDEGELVRFSLYPALIRSDARLSYSEADGILIDYKAAIAAGGDIAWRLVECSRLARAREAANGFRVRHMVGLELILHRLRPLCCLLRGGGEV